MTEVVTYEDLREALGRLVPDAVDSDLQITLTPALAQAILEHDPVNRKLRPWKVPQYVRAIQSGKWWAARSLPMMFFPDGRLGDGQHRCHAVVASGMSIPIRVIVATGTYGIDEGLGRSLADYLALNTQVDKHAIPLVALVTRTLCQTKAPTDEELMAFFEEHSAFILTSVQKVVSWLGEHGPEIAKAIKPGMLASVRARAIYEEKLSETAVDDLLYDVVNGGVQGGPGSYAQQISRQLHQAYGQAKTVGARDVLGYVKGALDAQQVGAKVKNIITAAKKRRKAPAREAA